ncbi:LysM peptidoglycan-binding domain-containing protein [Arthrobacter sp. PAMC25284]|uniref:LysM peptidoglycan-binding domain-containing protein n=1 Tax=Arthrobacter sp. PAMC25284 TaxID=2861279 RepID=UPI001C634B81|nr:LysM peptidoglycan-binding domain-containing protein [Arthrobacter sp. PAMC25284]
MSVTSAFQDTQDHSYSGRSGHGDGGKSGRVVAGRHNSAGGHLWLVPDAPSDRLAPLRLTRRGRFVVFGMPLVLLAALLLSLGGFFNAPAKAAESVSELSVTPTVTVTVQAGESLWAIAGAVSPERDPRDVIADIVQLNNLEAARVMPGQQLFVPTS